MLGTASTRSANNVHTSFVASTAIGVSQFVQGPSELIMHAVADTAAFAVTAWLCLCHLPVAVSWSCNLTMTGDRGRPQNLSLAQTTLRCTSDAGEVGALPVGFSDKLLNRSLQGHYSDLSFVAKDIAATGEQPPCCSVLVTRFLLNVSASQC